MNTASHRSGRGAASVAAFVILVTMVVFAPLVRGGNRPLPLLVLELLAIVGLLVALVPAEMRQRIPPAAAIVAGLCAAIPLLGLMPVPAGLWQALPGRAPFAETLGAAGSEGWRALSIAPFETEYAGLALLPPLAAFFLAMGLSANRLGKICVLVIVVAAVEAVLGLLQYGAAGGQLANFRASGTYVNPNHFAGLMLLALPLALMSLALEIGERARARRFAAGMVDVFRQFAAAKGTRILLWLFAIVLILLALMFSRSRAGISIAAFGIALTALLAAPKVGGPRAYGAVGVGLTVALGFALAIGLVPVLDRFAQTEMIDDGRGPMIMAALDMAGTYFPVGAGMGTFATLYPPFQPADISALVHRAHNDYVEWLTEGGALAALAIIAGMALFTARVVMLIRIPQKNATHYLQLAAAVSVFLLAAHGMVDFNFRIPANALLFALLAGVVVARQSVTSPVPQAAVAHRRVVPKPTMADVVPVVPAPGYAATSHEEAARVRAAWDAPTQQQSQPGEPQPLPSGASSPFTNQADDPHRGANAAGPAKA